jgi:hypothetical protein
MLAVCHIKIVCLLAKHYASVDLTHINMLTDLYMSMMSGV